MKPKHLRQRVANCLSLAELSPCVRRQFGCVIVDPDSNVILSEGYNGTLRGGDDLCGGDACKREEIESGTCLEIGCVHAEQNAIYNAARLGVSLVGAWVIVNGEPCKVCAKAIVQVGVVKVICVENGYSCKEGVEILRSHNVKVSAVAGVDDESGLAAILRKPVSLPRLSHYEAVSPFSKPSDTLP